MSLLYESESRGVTPSEVLGLLPVKPDPYVIDLVMGVGTGQPEIDERIRARSIDWPLERMPALDRALLRLAVYELGEQFDIPAAVVISEAVELAGIYSTDSSSRFVNGLLAAIGKELRPANPTPS